MEFEVGKKYTGKNNDGKPILIQIITKYPDTNSYSYETLKGGTDCCAREFDGDTVFAENLKPYEDLPRICRVLGGEDTPLKIGERFKFGTETFYLCNDGDIINEMYTVKPVQSVIIDMINHPDKIIRSPQFSEDEKALMRLCGDNGYWQWYREKCQLYVKEFDEMYGAEMHCISMKGITGQYTHEKPFNAETYLESEGKNDG
jgi:hypothetical protein